MNARHRLFIGVIACTAVSCSQSSADDANPARTERPAAAGAADKRVASMYEIPLTTLDGEPTTLNEHAGKAWLIVNVASKCGLTPQYNELEKLQKQYAERGFTVLGFPCNQFGGQEPGSAEEIKRFCSLTYGVTFPMFAKIEVNGPGRHPLYELLTPVADASGHAGDIRWNFEKFVVSADGKSITRFAPATSPTDKAVIAAIEDGLPPS